MTIQSLKKINWKIWVVIVLSIVFLLNRHNGHTYTAFDVEGEANLFPVNAENKNYRVKTYWTVAAVPRGFYGEKRSYELDYITWSNGGQTYFTDCKIIPLEEKNICEDDDLRTWRIEIQSDPLY